ncbi:MAG: hypothetical protein AB7S86_00600 [Hydrogenophaga sp.]|uniref:hypothetical protein n=1 Tax=Hydrogenophaga sp. TaxID=1904254 RepID=UPI003D098E7F
MGVLLLAFVPAALFFFVGIYLQPLDGDLTRIGSHAERDHGWNAPQAVFEQPRYTQGDYTLGHDMVVIGDSFATAMPQHQWQNQLAAATGMSIVTVSSYTTSVAAVLQSSVFAQQPPRFFVLTYTERHFPSQIGKDVQCDGFVPVLHASMPVEVQPAAALPTIDNPMFLHRQTHWSDWRDVKLAHAAKHVVYGVVRSAFGHEPTKALSIGLSRTDLFSSAKPSTMLVFRGDVDKVAQWREAGLDELSCRIEKLRQRVEANGHTRFVLLVPPDKLTAYSPWTNRHDLQSLSQLAELSQRHPSVMPRLDQALITAIGQGHKDVYLPNNTHWGSNGHLVVAQTLIHFLKPASGH